MSAAFAIGRLQVRISAWATSHQGYSAFHPSGVGKWVPAIAGKAKAGMAHSDCGWTCGCTGKTVRSLENTCHTWALLRWWFTMKRRYIKCMHLSLPLRRVKISPLHTWSPAGCSINKRLHTYTQASQRLCIIENSRPEACFRSRVFYDMRPGCRCAVSC